MPFAERIFSYCPRCGARAFTPRKPGLLSCSACGLVFFINIAAAVAAVIHDGQGRIFCARRAQDPGKGLLDLPGGFVDAGESAEEALRRELREELGMEIESLSLFGSAPNEYDYEGITYRTLDLFFECEVINPSAVRPLEEIQEILFLHPHDIPLDQLAFPSARAMVRKLRERAQA